MDNFELGKKLTARTQELTELHRENNKLIRNYKSLLKKENARLQLEKNIIYPDSINLN